MIFCQVILEKSGKLVYSPSLSQFTTLINTTSKDMISMLSTIQRLKNNDSGDTIAASIANEDEVLKAMITIMGGNLHPCELNTNRDWNNGLCLQECQLSLGKCRSVYMMQFFLSA